MKADNFDPMNANGLEEPARLEALPREAVVSLLGLSGAETVVDYGAGTGIYLDLVEAHEPGELLPYHVALIAEKP